MPADFPVTALVASSGPVRITMAAGTDVGLRYPANFDVLELSAEPPMAVVADGMGGGRGSAVAGSTAMGAFLAAVRDAGPGIGAPALRAAVARAQREVRAAGERLAELTGCTLTALIPSGGEAWIAQVGDSRVYRWRDGLLELLTVDHTMAWLGAVHGWYPADSPAAAAARYQLTRYLGHPALPEPDLLNVALRAGDVFGVCTDGLAEQVSYQRLAQLLDPRIAPASAVATLLADARAAGGRDNATLAVVRVETG
jgi:serine/threonine protein phosphatase PrpC